ncbi:MAG TPA: right-handed parallel beta-helix repeat-containing protein [Thermoleophilaceae bacterium]
MAQARVLGAFVRGERCRRALRLIEAYQRCRSSVDGGRCSSIRRRCLRPAFLGHCRRSERFYYRSVGGFRCVERRKYEIRSAYEADVVCTRGKRRFDYSYTLFDSGRIDVGTERELRAAWANPRMRHIAITRDIVLHACVTGDPMRESSGPVVVDGRGHTLRQGCFEKRLLRQDGTGYVELRNLTLTRGGSDGPGGAVCTRGEITVIDSKIQQNLAEEPGGGIMSQRRATIIRSTITGNLANDDGGGVYARRGGIQVYDSILSANLVDGSGGALGSTGDILVVRSHLDGNTTDGDGGAIYADEDGDVTVIDSTVSGSDADGPGGAIFTLDGDVTIVNSTLTGNRADDRGGAVSGEAAVIVINSTISRNLAIAHVGGGLWSRGPMYVGNSTVSDNYAEGKGGGLHAGSVLALVNSTVADNVASAAANIGVGERLEAFGSVIGPAKLDSSGDAQPTDKNCDTPIGRSLGFNVVTDTSCRMTGPGDLIGIASSLTALRENGGSHETKLPDDHSPALGLVPGAACLAAPLPVLHEGDHHLAAQIPDLRTLMRTDQRGIPRAVDGRCDAGAVEVPG